MIIASTTIRLHRSDQIAWHSIINPLTLYTKWLYIPLYLIINTICCLTP